MEAAEAIHATGVFRSRSDNPTMAISGSDWYDSFDIEWAHKDLGFTDRGWRMKIMDGGMLLLEGKQPLEGPPGSWVAPPHAWTRVKTPSVDLTAIKPSDWCNNSAGARLYHRPQRH